MAANHVPSDQTQDIYANSYQHLFNSADRYGTPSWDSQLNQQTGLATNASGQHWHNGAFTQQSFPSHGQSYATQNPSARTPSPYQYGQFGQQGSIGNYGQSSNVDPSLGLDPSTIRQQQQSPYPMPMRHSTPQSQPGTITPQALQHNVASVQQHRPSTAPYQIPKSTTEMFAQQRSMPATSFVQPVRVPEYEIPKGRKSGGLYVVDQAALAKATNSIALNKFVTLGSESFHLATNRTALPAYTARQSIKDLKKAGADSKKLRAKLALAKSQSKVLKSVKKPTESLAGLKREVSDSGSSSESSDDDSDYTDDEEEEEMPISASRPDDPHEAVRYDVIKATWFPSSSSPSSDKIKNSMREIWEVLSTIQKRWRIDSKAVADAEDQKKVGELPVLKSRVTSQRDLLLSALKAMLEYSHPDVVYQMGLIKPFLYLCYQFLANRFHSKDYDGPLAAAIFEVLSRCGTLTSDLLEETKVIKALTSMKKHANEKHKAFIQQIMDSAAANTKKAKLSPPPSAGPTENKAAKRPAAELGARSGSEGPAVKKAKSVEPLTNGAKKDLGTAPSKASATSSATQKKPGEKPAAAPAPIKTRVNQVNNKPSSIFASLTAAAKKPAATPSATANKSNVPAKPATAAATKDKKPAASTAAKPAFSFAQTMASLIKPKEQEVTPVKPEKQYPAETSEEKAKRLRKESRRHLRVTFRPDASLVDIKYFTHVPEEEEGHDENFVRDAGDIGGEGRMFKQHKELDEDEDEDPEEVEYRPWTAPSRIDFSKMPPEADGNFAPYGGGTKTPSTPEKDANVQRENLTLMVFYSNASDIPPSPREPPEVAQEAAPATVVNFGTPPESVLKKCPQPAQLAVVPDYSRLEGLIASLSNVTTGANQTPFTAPPAPPQETFVPPPPAGPAPDLAALLASLGQAPPAPMPVQAPPQQQTVPPPFDYASLVATMQAQAANGISLPPPPPGPMPFAFPFGVQPPMPDATAFQPPMQSQYGQQDYSQQDQYNQQSNGGNKRSRDDGTNNNNSNSNQAQGKRHKGRGERPHKVLACKFFHKGTCNKGDNCTYIHDLNM
ncbi:hypothetical protein NX059_007747 [Plenodomus lindquistii]|nr:hypothetical protein NX059_007747 [Plenodomus lindquistii]